MKPKSTIVFLLTILITILLSAGCGKTNLPEVDYSRFYMIPEEGIPQNWVYEFNPTQSDSLSVISKAHNIVIVVRYTYECASEEVVLNLEEMSLDNQKPDSTELRLRLFDKKGNPAGRRGYGIFEVSDTIRRNFRIGDGYALSVSSPIPDEQTRGIKAIGIVLVD